MENGHAADISGSARCAREPFRTEQVVWHGKLVWTHRQLGNLLGKSKKFLVRRRRAAPAKGGAATGVSAPSSASWRPRMILVDGRDQIGAAACAPGWRSGCSVANASICMQAPRMRRAVG